MPFLVSVDSVHQRFVSPGNSWSVVLPHPGSRSIFLIPCYWRILVPGEEMRYPRGEGVTVRGR